MFTSIKLKKLYFGVLFIIFPFFSFSQAKIIKGTVYSKEDKSTVPNAKLYLRGYENQNTYSQADGKYELVVPEAIITTGKVRLYIIPQGHNFPQSIDIPIDFEHEINIQVKAEPIERNDNLIAINDNPDKQNDEELNQEKNTDGEEDDDEPEAEEETVEVLEVAEEEENDDKKEDNNEIENQIEKEINAIKTSLENENLSSDEINALASRLEKLEKQTSNNPEFDTYGTEIASLKEKIDELKNTDVSFGQNSLIFISILGFIIFLLFILFFLYRKRRKKEDKEDS